MKPAPTVEIDGAIGEGGGQILRSALALSLVTGKPCRLANIRAGRSRPGLQRQHLAAVAAAAEVGSAEVAGNTLGSRELSFAPACVRAGSYTFSVGTAGSTTLVLQTVLPALAIADGPSRIALAGGTHNPFAPPFDFLDRVFLPIVNRMGPRVLVELARPGFYPAGGGLFHASVEPVARLAPIDLVERGAIMTCRALARVSNLPIAIAERELATAGRALAWPPECFSSEAVEGALGPGNVLTIEIESANVTELFTAFGRRGVPAERVAALAVEEAAEYLASGAPVGRHLADQLLVPLAIAGGGRYRTVRPTRHTRTNVEVVRKFIEADISIVELGRDVWEIAIGPGRW